MEQANHKVVIVGGGFGGLETALGLNTKNIDVTLIDRRNFHLFQPLLYQVATGGLSPANIAAPLRSVLSRYKNARVLLGEVTGFDVANKQVLLGDDRIPYDTLVLATGSGPNYFRNPEWELHAPGLKTVEDATEIRRRLLLAFEKAERMSGAGTRKKYMTFVIVGGGPTGVELAGSISELARQTLKHDFRTLDPKTAHIILVENSDRLLGTFPPRLSGIALDKLKSMGIEVRLQSSVRDIQEDHAMVEHEGKLERIDTSTVIWAAGVKASPLGKILADATGTSVDRGGKVSVEPNLTITNHPNIFVLGDLAGAKSADGKPLPGVAPVAIQQGDYVSDLIKRRLDGRNPRGPFRYWDKGNMATIGRNAAVVDIYWWTFSGWFAWLIWLFIHIMYLVQFQNRMLVLFQWFWNYWTRNRAARLITGEEARRDKEMIPVSLESHPAKTGVH